MSRKRKVTGYGYVGEWSDNTLGWFLPRHLSHHHSLKRPSTPYPTFDSAKGEFGVLCKITIEEVPGRSRRRTKEAK